MSGAGGSKSRGGSRRNNESWFRRWGIEEPERQPVTRGWVRGRAEESMGRSGSRRSTAGSPALEDREAGARGLDSPVMPAATNGPGSGTGRNRTLRWRLRGISREISRELSGTYLWSLVSGMTRLHPGLTKGRSQANKRGVMSV